MQEIKYVCGKCGAKVSKSNKECPRCGKIFDKKIDSIIKEELWRSIATFFFAFIFINMFISKIIKSYKPSYFTMLGLPLLIAFIVFLILVFVRKK